MVDTRRPVGMAYRGCEKTVYLTVKRGPGREFPVGHAQGLRLRLRLRPRPRLPLREHPGNGRTLTVTTSGYPVNRRYP